MMKIGIFKYGDQDMFKDGTELCDLINIANSDLKKNYHRLNSEKELGQDEPLNSSTAEDAGHSTIIKEKSYYAQQEAQIALCVVNNVLSSEKSELVDGQNPILRLAPISPKEARVTSKEDLKLILNIRKDGLTSIANKLEEMADKLNETIPAERKFYEAITTNLDKLGWSVQHLRPGKGLFICYGLNGARLSSEYTGIAQVVRNISSKSSPEDLEQSAKFIIPHKTRQRLVIRSNFMGCAGREEGVVLKDYITKSFQGTRKTTFDQLAEAQRNIFELEVFEGILRETSTSDYIDSAKSLTFFIPIGPSLLSVELLDENEFENMKNSEHSSLLLYDASLTLSAKILLRMLHKKNLSKPYNQNASGARFNILDNLKKTVAFRNLVWITDKIIRDHIKRLSPRLQIRLKRKMLGPGKIVFELHFFSRKITIRIVSLRVDLFSEFTNVSHCLNTKTSLSQILSNEIMSACMHKFREEVSCYQSRSVMKLWMFVPLLNVLSGPIINQKNCSINLKLTSKGEITDKDPHIELIMSRSKGSMSETHTIHLLNRTKDGELQLLTDAFKQIINAVTFC